MGMTEYSRTGRASSFLTDKESLVCRARVAGAFLAGPAHLISRLVLADALIDDLPHQALIGPGKIIYLHDQLGPDPVNPRQLERRSAMVSAAAR